MKTKRTMALVLVLVVCMAVFAPPIAQARGAIYCISKLKSGDTYAELGAMQTESLYVEFSLYKVNSTTGAETFVTSKSASATGRTVLARHTGSLSSGTYKMYIYGFGNTTTYSDTVTVKI